jgi:DNA polymerase-4
VASDINKPDGLTFIGPSKVASFIEKLPVEKFFGVGKVTAEKMKKMGLFTGADLKKLTEAQMTKHFGKTGKFFFKIVRGIDDRDVKPDRETKSVGAEDTFSFDLTTLDEMYYELDKITRVVHQRLLRHNLKGRTITLKIKYHDFKIVTRSQSFTEGVDDKKLIGETVKNLLRLTDPETKKIRLLGVSLSNFGDAHSLNATQHDEDQLRLF